MRKIVCALCCALLACAAGLHRSYSAEVRPRIRAVTAFIEVDSSNYAMRIQEAQKFLATAKPYAAALHDKDPEIILQAAAFEIVTRDVETISIPEHVRREFGQTSRNRTFRYEDMLYHRQSDHG